MAWCGIARQSAASPSLLQIYQFPGGMVVADQEVGQGDWTGAAILPGLLVHEREGSVQVKRWGGKTVCSHQLLGLLENVARCSGVSTLFGALPPDHKDTHKTIIIPS